MASVTSTTIKKTTESTLIDTVIRDIVYRPIIPIRNMDAKIPIVMAKRIRFDSLFPSSKYVHPIKAPNKMAIIVGRGDNLNRIIAS